MQIDFSIIPKDIFTRRELDIMQAVYDGLTNQSISDKLNISIQTVKSYTNDIIRKFSDRIDLNGYNPRVVLVRYYAKFFMKSL